VDSSLRLTEDALMQKSRVLLRLSAALLAAMLLLSACRPSATEPPGPGPSAGAETTDGNGQTSTPGTEPGERADADPAEPADEPADEPAAEPVVEEPLPEVTIEFIGGPVVAVNEDDAGRRFVMLTYDDGPKP